MNRDLKISWHKKMSRKFDFRFFSSHLSVNCINTSHKKELKLYAKCQQKRLTSVFPKSRLLLSPHWSLGSSSIDGNKLIVIMWHSRGLKICTNLKLYLLIWIIIAYLIVNDRVQSLLQLNAIIKGISECSKSSKLFFEVNGICLALKYLILCCFK